MRPRSIIAAAAAVALTTLAAPASTALAAPTPTGVQIIYQDIFPSTPPTGNNPVQNIQANVACPSGYQVTGSGGGPNPGPIMPVGDFTKASVQGSVTLGGPGYFVGEVVCAPAGQFTDVGSSALRDHTVKAGTWVRDVASCPSGSYAFGGGGQFNNLAIATVESNGPTLDGRSWEFTANVPGGASTLVVSTRCATRTGHDFLSSISTPVSSTQPLQSSTAYAYCPAGYQEIAGGYHVMNANGTPFVPTSSTPQAALPLWTVPVSASATQTSSWYANVFTPPGTYLTVAAQCVS
jgi:hypothetical protein